MSDKKTLLRWINTRVVWDKYGNEIVVEGYWYSGALSLLHPAYTSDQSDFQWGDDDAGETTHTLLGTVSSSQDFDVTSGNVQQFLRLVIAETGGAEGDEGAGFQLEFSINGGAYTNLTTTSTGCKAYDSTNVTEGEGGDTTQRVGTGTFISTNEGIIEDGTGDFTVAFSGTDETEALYTVEFVTADLSDNDSINFRVAALDGWTSVANATITLSGVVDHVATGALLAQDAVTSGSAAVIKTHVATGALLAQDATIAGTALRDQTHDATGALLAQDAVIAGTASRSSGAITHVATGALSAQDAVIAGTALRDQTHDATGALLAQDAVIAGTALRDQTHDATGALLGQDAVTSGTAAVIKIHDATGALLAQDATIAGTALRGAATFHAAWAYRANQIL